MYVHTQYLNLLHYQFGATSDRACERVQRRLADDCLHIEDTVVIPADIEPGEYVLGWRDCEQTTQTWQSCSDITII